MRNKDKHKGFAKLLYKVLYSIRGLIYFYKTEKSAFIHMAASLVMIILSIVFNISLTEWMVVVVCLLSILSMEIINTSMEVTVDMITMEYNENAKNAKDLGSGATFIVSCMTFVCAMIIFIPKIISLFN